MKAAQWLRCEDPRLMLNAIAGAASERKLRLFAAACWRRSPRSRTDAGCTPAVDVAERYADWLVHDDVLDQAHQAAINRSDSGWGMGQYEFLLVREMTASLASAAALGAALEVQAKARRADSRLQRQARRAQRKGARPEAAEPVAVQAAALAEYRQQCALLRDLFSPHFRPVGIAPGWRMRDVIDLARAAYDERHLPSGELDAHRLSVLADALEEAGAQGELVGHLRGPGTHVRGCFAVDLCLGLS